MHIYRVERLSDKFGPFRCLTTCNAVMEYAASNNLPSMHGSSVVGHNHPDRMYYRLGCRTLWQLIEWFDEDTRYVLHQRGFVLSVYNVREIVKKDAWQVMVFLKYKRPVVIHSLLDIKSF